MRENLDLVLLIIVRVSKNLLAPDREGKDQRIQFEEVVVELLH